MEQKTYAFSAKALTSETPRWAKNTFRITFAITTALAFFMAGTQIVPEHIKFEVLLALKALDGLVYTLSKMFGVEPADLEN